MGKMCVLLTAGGGSRMLRSVVCVPYMVDLLGRRTWIPMGSDLILRRRMSHCRYSFPLK